MNISIRLYNESLDYEMLSSWWEGHGQAAPRKDMLPEDTTYVLEVNGKPLLSACLYLMNCKAASLVENVISNPLIFLPNRKQLVSALFSHIENVAKSKGYNTLVIFSYEDKVKNRYEELGFTKTLNNVTTFSKEVI